MKSREMYAPPDWGELTTFALSKVVYRGCPVRVLVQEIPEGRPDFAPGDRVRRPLHEYTGEVVGHPFIDHKSGGWRVPVYVCHEPNYRAWPCGGLTKLPREITRTIRVTGEEAAVNEVVSQAQRAPQRVFDVRVEVSDAD